MADFDHSIFANDQTAITTRIIVHSCLPSSAVSFRKVQAGYLLLLLLHNNTCASASKLPDHKTQKHVLRLYIP
ncbi:hypothetical protein LOAG_02098 [Loa loa]|uniref:Uncharacterized protein n=1 Tax=Loa loa TaxID=7209 RepID=A0A1S0U7Z4_LOALO|nr:hypothetical protein LOAG_02098 [Loa loa]EFO26390.2 hypothetical protein LOAG_02098 [Loa loa]